MYKAADASSELFNWHMVNVIERTGQAQLPRSENSIRKSRHSYSRSRNMSELLASFVTSVD